MNKPLSLLLRFAGFNRPAPKTRLNRILLPNWVDEDYADYVAKESS